MRAEWMPTIGAVRLGEKRHQFRIWAPRAERVQLHLVSPDDRLIDMEREDNGYYHVTVDNAGAGTQYYFNINGNDRPDPASHFQPRGVRGPSEIVDPNFVWTDHDWRGITLKDYILYELHVGTYTVAGTFEGIIDTLDSLVELGITAIELMPIAQFSGDRNWGYDGVYPYAPQNSYGGPNGLRRLVDACHARGIAVVLDVVYNHFGPEGNYVGEYGGYFTNCYTSPWGSCLNFDQEGSDEVRRFFIENALYWFTQYHIDALRLDATHAIMDFSAKTFLEQLAEAVDALREQLGRHLYLIAENSRNDARLTRPRSEGGIGMDAQWNDDFHHALRTLLTGDQTGYYEDYGDLSKLVKAYREGFVFTGDYSYHLRRHHGTPSRDIPPWRFVVFSQNHDHIGNRAFGEPLSEFLSFEELKVVAATVLLSPYLPMLFMGEEYDEPSPFMYFVSFSDPALIEGVRQGRKNEFAAFLTDGDPPDPQDDWTFQQSKLNHNLRRVKHHGVLFELYKELIRLRKTVPALRYLSKDDMEVFGQPQPPAMIVRRWHEDDQVLAAYNYGADPTTLTVLLPEGCWTLCLDSSSDRWCWPESEPENLTGQTALPRPYEAPPQFQSDGSVELQLNPKAFVVYRRVPQA